MNSTGSSQLGRQKLLNITPSLEIYYMGFGITYQMKAMFATEGGLRTVIT
jgi:hypothetical protein